MGRGTNRNLRKRDAQLMPYLVVAAEQRETLSCRTICDAIAGYCVTMCEEKASGQIGRDQESNHEQLRNAVSKPTEGCECLQQ